MKIEKIIFMRNTFTISYLPGELIWIGRAINYMKKNDHSSPKRSAACVFHSHLNGIDGKNNCFFPLAYAVVLANDTFSLYVNRFSRSMYTLLVIVKYAIAIGLSG